MPQVTKVKDETRTVVQPDGSVITDSKPVRVWVHCINQQCDRYHDLQNDLDFENEVPGWKTETFHTFVDRGGDMPGVENSFVSWEPQRNEDRVCVSCSEPLNVSSTPSRRLTKHSFKPGEGLEGAQRAAAIAAAKVAQQGADDRAVQSAELEELRQQIAELKAARKEAA